MSVAVRGSLASHRTHVGPGASIRWRPEVPARRTGAEAGRHLNLAPGRGIEADRHTREVSHKATGTSRPATPARVRRRRLLLGLGVAGILVALALPWGGAGGHTLATPGTVLAGATVSPHALYVVQPGDTMWSLAVRLDPSGDPRVIVGELQSQVGSDTLRVGERLRLP